MNKQRRRRRFGAAREHFDAQRTGPILIALSSPVDRARVERAFAKLGRDVVAVNDGYRLTEKLADSILGVTEDRPSLIVLEPILPGCTGLSLLRGLRGLGWRTPVILLTEREEFGSRSEAWAQGVTGVFVKPFEDVELRAFARLVLEIEPAVNDCMPAAETEETLAL